MAKSPRQIQVRDDLWSRVDALAQRRGISPDEVVQAALVQLFSKKRPAPGSPGSGARTMPPGPARTAAPAAARPGGLPAPGPGGGLPRPGSGTNRLPPPGSGLPPPSPGLLGQQQQAQPLYLQYQGQWYAIDQDQFVIGRGTKYSDLAIKDANISRRHAAVVRRNGEYFITDLESTNGVEFHGQRVDNHRIEEGAVYRMCDHEIRFSFIPPA